MLRNNWKFIVLLAVCSMAFGCRYDMQDQPKLKAYRSSEFFTQNRMGSRPLVEGTVPRGYLREDKALYTGKKENVTATATTATGGTTPAQDGGMNSKPNSTAAATVVSYPNDITEFPIPVTKELLNRGEERYRVFCIVCHGPTGNGDGMIVRRGYTKPPSYHTEQLRGAPVGHFYDVITNGWGRMSGYAAQVPVTDRWAIAAYIRTLQLSQNPEGMKSLPMAKKDDAPDSKAQVQIKKDGGRN